MELNVRNLDELTNDGGQFERKTNKKQQYKISEKAQDTENGDHNRISPVQMAIDSHFSTTCTVATPASSNCRYGWFRYRPQFLQCLTNEKWILICLCMASAIQGMVVNGFVNVVISNIEKRFDLSSTESGSIASCYDIASVVCLIPVTYFGGLGRKPRYLFVGVFIMGVGSLIFSLPHFLSGVYQITSSTAVGIFGHTTDMCHRGNTSAVKYCESMALPASISSYKHLFFWGQLLHGAGASPLYTIATTYMDENFPKKQSPLYIGIFYAMSILGPAIGYLAGGAFIDIFTDYRSVDVKSLGIDPSHPKWVGAWWIGFLISAALAFVTALPISGYPVELKREPADDHLPLSRQPLLVISDCKVTSCEKSSEVYLSKTSASKEETLSSTKASFNHIFNSAKVLLLNPTFMFLNLAAAMEGLILSGFSTFAPKFIETQFLLDSGTAAKYIGFAAIPAGGGGTLLGAYIVRKFDLHVRGILRLCVVCSFVSIFLLLVFLMQCETMPFAGVNDHYHHHDQNASLFDMSTSAVTNLSAVCNVNCDCDVMIYNPVCGDDTVMYYSPCYAGCSQTTLKEGVEKFTNCSCISSTRSTSPLGGSEAREGKCTSRCSYLPVFMCFFTLLMLLTFVTSMPALQASLRAIPFYQRSFGLGIQWIVARCLGSIPGPILFGRIIDLTCTLWQSKCEEVGSCRFYDNRMMGRYLMALSMAGKFISCVCFCLSLFLYRGPSIPPTELSPDGEVYKENELIPMNSEQTNREVNA